MELRDVFRYDDVRKNRDKTRGAIIASIVSDLESDDGVEPENIQATLDKITWSSSDDLIVNKFVDIFLI